MRVMLVCEPPLLNDVLALALGELPEVELVDGGSPSADVVIANGADFGDAWQAARERALALRARLVAVDPLANAIQVWEWDKEQPAGEPSPGTLAALGQLCQPSPSDGREPP